MLYMFVFKSLRYNIGLLTPNRKITVLGYEIAQEYSGKTYSYQVHFSSYFGELVLFCLYKMVEWWIELHFSNKNLDLIKGFPKHEGRRIING